MKLYGDILARLDKTVKTADGSFEIPAGTVVHLQFEPDTPVIVVPHAYGAQRHVTASFKELAGSDLVEGLV